MPRLSSAARTKTKSPLKPPSNSASDHAEDRDAFFAATQLLLEPRGQDFRAVLKLPEWEEESRDKRESSGFLRRLFHRVEDREQARIVLRVNVPSRYGLDIASEFGDIHIEGLEGDIRIDHRSGRISVENSGGSFEARNHYADLEVVTFAGDVHYRGASSAVSLRDITGNATVYNHLQPRIRSRCQRHLAH